MSSVLKNTLFFFTYKKEENNVESNCFQDNPLFLPHPVLDNKSWFIYIILSLLSHIVYTKLHKPRRNYNMFSYENLKEYDIIYMYGNQVMVSKQLYLEYETVVSLLPFSIMTFRVKIKRLNLTHRYIDICV